MASFDGFSFLLACQRCFYSCINCYCDAILANKIFIHSLCAWRFVQEWAHPICDHAAVPPALSWEYSAGRYTSRVSRRMQLQFMDVVDADDRLLLIR